MGGSSIKSALVDLETGECVDSRTPTPTPPFQRSAISEAVLEIVRGFGARCEVGVGFPATIQHGIVTSPPTAHEVDGWVGFDLAASLEGALGRAVRVGNDADVAGLAEVRFGAARDQPGVVLVLTLGTGIGSALFNRGQLVPNTELGKLYLASSREAAERSVASRVKTEAGLSWRDWTARLDAYLAHVDRLFSPDLVILGGGISVEATRFIPDLSIRCEVRAAALTQDAGVIGAALLA